MEANIAESLTKIYTSEKKCWTMLRVDSKAQNKKTL
jgi:hypothetical protein